MTGEHYDVMIVGAGSAGACLAARLSEDSSRNVLVVEAGPDYRSSETPDHLHSLDPMLALVDPAFQWPGLRARRTENQRASPYLRGRGVGGSSAINAQIAIRGIPDDYDTWSAMGCTGWSFDDVLPAFRRLEDEIDFPDALYHGRNGPIPIQRNRQDAWGTVDHGLADAACALGYGWCDDHNALEGTGVSPLAYNARDGRRVSTNDGYLEPARARPNLTIRGDTLVDRVLFEGGRAVGVRARVDGEWRNVPADEIVIAAGAVHSPALLIRSGIGPADDLARLGVGVVADLPVGRGFTDHPMVFFPIALRTSARSTAQNVRHLNCYVRYGSGIDASGANDMFVASLNSAGPAEALRGLGGVAVGLHQPVSRGRIEVRTTDPEAQPRIDSRLLSQALDLVRMRDGVLRVMELLRHRSLDEICEFVSYGFTGRNIDELRDSDEIDRWLLAGCYDVSHAAGTCRMGSPGDERSVVDPLCQVLGIDNLRVVDASVMPEIPRANTHLTTVMIAEHVATQA